MKSSWYMWTGAWSCPPPACSLVRKKLSETLGNFPATFRRFPVVLGVWGHQKWTLRQFLRRHSTPKHFLKSIVAFLPCEPTIATSFRTVSTLENLPFFVVIMGHSEDVPKCPRMLQIDLQNILGCCVDVKFAAESISDVSHCAPRHPG